MPRRVTGWCWDPGWDIWPMPIDGVSIDYADLPGFPHAGVSAGITPGW